MNEFMKILLSLSVSGTLLVFLVLGLKLLYKNKFSRRWQYYIWIIVVLRFLLSFTPDTTIVGSLFGKINATVLTNESHANPNVSYTVNMSDNETKQINANEQFQPGTPDKPQINGNTKPPADKSTIAAALGFPNAYMRLLFAWSTLALVLFVRKITIYQGFIRYIKAGNTEISDIKTLNLLSDCMEKLNIKTKVELYSNTAITSPIMIGFFRSSIVLPAGELGDKELYYIFVHELLHYKKKDMFYKWLIQIVICIHWFNPFVYLLEKEVNKACELSCDEAVISVLDESARREYGDTLISFMRSNNLNKNSLASVTLTEGAEQLKERLGAIMDFKKKSKLVTVITAIFTIAVCFSFLAVGAYAAPSVNSNRAVWEDAELDDDLEDEVLKMETLEFRGKTYYLVFNEEQLRAIGTGAYGMDNNYMQQADIQLSTDEWIPIGTWDNPFTGTFNGNGFEIIGLTMTDPDAKIIGLFGVAQNADIYNVILRDYDIVNAGRNVSGKTVGAILAVGQGVRSYDNIVYPIENSEDGTFDWYRKVKDLESDFDRNDKDEDDDWDFDWTDEFEDDDWNFDWADESANDKWDWDWDDKAFLEEYAAYGIEKVDNLFYYQGELVYILKDQRPDSSCYLLDTNSKGTVSIKVNHNEEGKITGISYMTDEEVQELLPKLLGPSVINTRE